MPQPPARAPQFAPQFTQLLSSSRRGARLARLLTVEQLAAWGWARDDERTEAAALVVSELAANAVRHGRLPGRGFRLEVALTPRWLRIEVTDPRGELLPAVAASGGEDAIGGSAYAEADEGGRGLVLVAALADRWGVRPCPPSAKTVWADVRV